MELEDRFPNEASEAAWARQEEEPPEDWPFQSDGRDEFVPLDRAAHLAVCARCGAIIVGDVGGQAIHRVWHVNLERRIDQAAHALPQRYA